MQKTHHIRVDVLTNVDKDYKRTQATQIKNFEILNKMLAKEKESYILYEKVFEKNFRELTRENILKIIWDV